MVRIVRVTSVPGTSHTARGGQDALGQRSAVMGAFGTNRLHLCLSTGLQAHEEDLGILDAFNLDLLLLAGFE